MQITLLGCDFFVSVVKLDVMSSKLSALCIDANDPAKLAQFWAEALHWKIEEGDDDWVTLVPTDGTSFHIDIAPVPEKKEGQNRIHLDLTTTTIDDQKETVAQLLDLGGGHIDIGQCPDDPHVVLADPEGNELCIIEPTNNFLADTARLGAINCQGRAETGYFWSEVLGWPLVWDQDGETAIQSTGGNGPKITWSGLPLIPKLGKNRLHLDITSTEPDGQLAEVERVIDLGARCIDIGQGDVSWVVLADPDDNEFCILS